MANCYIFCHHMWLFWQAVLWQVLLYSWDLQCSNNLNNFLFQKHLMHHFLSSSLNCMVSHWYISSFFYYKFSLFYFSSSSPSLMLLMDAEATFGEEGGEAFLKSQGEGGDGERDGERPRVGLLVGLCLGDKAWSMRPLLSWNICFWKQRNVDMYGYSNRYNLSSHS